MKTRFFIGLLPVVFVILSAWGEEKPLFRTQEMQLPEAGAGIAGGSGAEEWDIDALLDTADAILDAPEEVGSPVGGGEVPVRQESLLDIQKRMFYLLARLGKSRTARPLGTKVLREMPSDKETLLVFCSMELERKNAAGVRRYARRFLEFYPDDDQGWYFIAAAESLQGHYAEAQGILEKMRATLFPDKEFPYKVDLASTARMAGDWRTALSTYKELLGGKDVSPKLRAEARRVLDEIYREQLPRISVSTQWQNLLTTGEILRSEAEWESPLTNRMRLRVNLQRNDLHQKANGAARSVREEYQQGTIGVDALVLRSWLLRASAGMSDAGALGAVELRRKLSPTRSWFVGASYNQIAQDSLALEILDGRQSRAYAGWDLTLDDEMDWRFSALGYVRTATVGGAQLGTGGGGEWQIERVVMRDPVSIRVAYVGQISVFNTTATDPALVSPLFNPGATPAQEEAALADEGVVAGSPETLISPYINYQGITVSARRDILPRWTVEVVGVGGYYIDTSQPSYGGYFRNYFRPRKSVEFQTNLGYLSSGVQSNTGSQVFELSLALQILF